MKIVILGIMKVQGLVSRNYQFVTVNIDSKIVYLFVKINLGTNSIELFLPSSTDLAIFEENMLMKAIKEYNIL